MKRTTIFIPEELERELQLYAGRAAKSVASIVREAVAAYIANAPDAGALPSFTGAFDSGHTDTAERHDDLLFRHLAPHPSPRTASPRRKGATGTRRSRRPAGR